MSGFANYFVRYIIHENVSSNEYIYRNTKGKTLACIQFKYGWMTNCVRNASLGYFPF